MKKFLMYLIIMLLSSFVVAGCMAKTAEQNCLPSSIGSAKMLKDGTIALRLRGETDGRIAETYFEIKPGDPRYNEVKQHLKGIKPGEEKPVPPWTDKNNKSNEGCSKNE